MTGIKLNAAKTSSVLKIGVRQCLCKDSVLPDLISYREGLGKSL